MAEYKERAIDETLALIGDEINDAKGVPLRKELCVIERDRILDMLDDVRENLPNDLKQAKSIVTARDQILQNARDEADKIIAAAREKGKALVAEEVIVQEARRQAEAVRRSTDAKVQEMKRTATAYVDDSLKTAEDSLTATLADVKKLRAQVKAVK